MVRDNEQHSNGMIDRYATSITGFKLPHVKPDILHAHPSTDTYKPNLLPHLHNGCTLSCSGARAHHIKCNLHIIFYWTRPSWLRSYLKRTRGHTDLNEMAGTVLLRGTVEKLSSFVQRIKLFFFTSSWFYRASRLKSLSSLYSKVFFNFYTWVQRDMRGGCV